jgi:hypothetical protein
MTTYTWNKEICVSEAYTVFMHILKGSDDGVW